MKTKAAQEISVLQKIFEKIEPCAVRVLGRKKAKLQLYKYNYVGELGTHQSINNTTLFHSQNP